jgi:phosphoribosylaminoimidazole carboxylase (NCAIR synthetase)
VLCAKQYHLFAKVLDEKQLKVVRVQARLMGYDGQGQKVIETFIHTGDKDLYSP